MEQAMTLPVTGQKTNIGKIVAYTLGGLTLLVGGYFVWDYFINKDEDGLTKFNRKQSGVKDIPDVAPPTDTPPVGSLSPKWIKATFPLRKGMYGGEVINLQKALGISSADGKFGSGTESKVMAKFGSSTVTKPQYDGLVNPTAIGGGSNWQQIQKSLAGTAGVKNLKDGLRLFSQGKNTYYYFDFYTNGRFAIVGKDGRGIKKGSYIDGGKKMKIDGDYLNYTEGDVRLNIQKIVNELGG